MSHCFFIKLPPSVGQLCLAAWPCLDSPSAWEQVNFNKGVRVAVVVPQGEVPGLQDVDNQVAELLVVVDLKLQMKKYIYKKLESVKRHRGHLKSVLYFLFLIQGFKIAAGLVCQTCISPETGCDWVFAPSAVCGG